MTGELYLDPNYNWIDPGAFALIGAAAFFGGVSRLTISLTIIMMEITNDIRFLLPIMTSILVSKLAADQLTHSLYHALLGTLKKAETDLRISVFCSTFTMIVVIIVILLVYSLFLSFLCKLCFILN